MSTRAVNRRQRRAAARELVAGDVDITSMIPAPPPGPAFHLWWHPDRREWFRHDQRVLDWIRVLAKLEDDPVVAEIHQRIGDALLTLEE